MRKLYLLAILMSMALIVNAQWRDGTCDPIDSLILVDNDGIISVQWIRNDTALAYNYRFRVLGETEWETNATLDSFFNIDESGDCVDYEISISTVCPFDTSTFTLDTLTLNCASATRNILNDPSTLSLYPVPFSDQLTIINLDPSSIRINQVIIRDLSGRLMRAQSNLNNTDMLQSYTQSWKAGVYLIEIETDKGWHFQKVLKL